MRHLSTLAIALTLLTAVAVHGAITVSSRTTLDEGIRAQAEITNSTGLSSEGNSITAIAIKEIHSTIFLRDLGVPSLSGGGGALIVQKRTLTSAEAYGQGLPQGYFVPPLTDPGGPWKGLIWPYRDQYDYFPNPGDPLGNDVGIPFFDEPDVYAFLNVNAIERGGPTDPVTPPAGQPGGGDVTWLDRGITGNGLNAPATYFAFDVFNNNFDQGEGSFFNHTVRLRIIAAEAIVVVRDSSGKFGEIKVPIPDYEITFPEPGSATALLAAAAASLARRRR